jgi:hypothetical protein
MNTDGCENPIGITLMTLMLLFANNYFSGNTPQGSSANVIFTSSG